MTYALLIYADESLQPPPPSEGERVMSPAYQAFNERHADRLRGGDALESTATATTLRVRDGEAVLTDGPFAEAREQLGGFYLVDADSLDEALEVAAEIPAARMGAAIEVRPVVAWAKATAA